MGYYYLLLVALDRSRDNAIFPKGKIAMIVSSDGKIINSSVDTESINTLVSSDTTGSFHCTTKVGSDYSFDKFVEDLDKVLY